MHRVRPLAVAAALAVAGALLAPARALDASATVAAPLTPGLTRLLDLPAGNLATRAVATFGGARPDARRLAALRRLGLEVQGLDHLPLALLRGRPAAMAAAVRAGVADDVYPDERLVPAWSTSNRTIGADVAHQLGFTGAGVGVAIVDTGVDATHDDLEDHVGHNVKIVSPEYVRGHGGREPALVVAVDQGPYDNGDTSGHGTHVAGIVAADGTTTPAQTGVAPDATILGYGAGDAVFIFTVLAAYDHILEHRDEWGIDVVNNSWGSGFRLFDPNEPINQASRALHAAGLVVVFAAGNSDVEMTINPYSVAPWVISVASETVYRRLSDFSSGGIEHDNSRPDPLPAAAAGGLHVRYEGDGTGIYHPDVAAPGSAIRSSGTPTGVGVASPTAPNGTATLSGTSMAAPHVAGAAALLLQANPSLSPDEVREVLEVTAVPLADDAPFFHAGYGSIDLPAALDLAQHPDLPVELARRRAEADGRVRARRTHVVRSTDFWSFRPAPASLAGTVESRRFTLDVPPATTALKAVLSYPSLGYLGVNPFDWVITVRDAAGAVVATSTRSARAGQSSLFADLAANAVVEQFGTWAVEVSAERAAHDGGAFMGGGVTLTVAQLTP